MVQLRLTAKIYIALLVLLAIGTTIYGLAHASVPSLERVALGFGLFFCMTIVILFPLHFAYKTKLALDTVVIFASILLFEPAIAILITGSGTLLAYLLRRNHWEPSEIAFNTAQAMLQTAAGGLLLMGVGWNFGRLVFSEPRHVLAIGEAAVLIFLVNTVAVAIIIGLQTGLAPYQVWRQSLNFDNIEQLAQFALGLLAAVVVDSQVWALPLLVLPAAAVYLSLSRHLHLRLQTIEALESLADVVDLRDPYTANHSRRVAEYAREIATAMNLSPDEVEQIERAARVHDVGKVVIDSSVLAKPKLDDAEWMQFKQHPTTGVEILNKFPQFSLATQFVLHHHERMDGRGYPDGLSGDAIPLGARIIAVADSFDAMATARPYRPALSAEVVINEFQRLSGIQWNEDVVATLFELVTEGQISLPGADAVLARNAFEDELIPAAI